MDKGWTPLAHMVWGDKRGKIIKCIYFYFLCKINRINDHNLIFQILQISSSIIIVNNKVFTSKHILFTLCCVEHYINLLILIQKR